LAVPSLLDVQDEEPKPGAANAGVAKTAAAAKAIK
jgi:hypothetical protein